jgi:thioredoxin-related protein
MVAFFSKNIAQQELKWTSIHDIKDSLAVKEKPILIKIETDWCGFCKKMDNEVLPYKKVVKELNKNYYYVKLNAESHEQILFNDTTYKYAIYPGSKKGVHQLAKKLGTQNGQIKYPTIVLLNSKLEVVKLLDGYLPKSHFYYWLVE